ncbi:MAG: hypothetical protein WCK11_04045 [Candidatus Falkowbacteria bacterium]
MSNKIINNFISLVKSKSFKRGMIFLSLLLIVLFVLPHLASAAPNPNATDSGTFTSWVKNRIVVVLGWVVYMIASGVGAIGAWLIGFMADVAMFNNIIDNDTVREGWKISRDLCNMFFILILLIIAFGTILRIDSYEAKKTLPKLIIMAILINFSKTICGLLIDFAQIFTITFANAFVSTGASNNLVSLLGMDKMWSMAKSGGGGFTGIDNQSNQDLGFSTLAGLLLALVATLIAVVVIIAIVVTLIMRIVMLWVYVILSPFAYLLAAFPSGQKYSQMWWQEFTANVLTGPILIFFMWLAFSTAQSSANKLSIKNEIYSNYNGTASIISAFLTNGVFTTYLITIGLMIAGLTVAQKVGGVGAGIAGKAMNKIQSGAALARSGTWKATKGVADWTNLKVAGGFKVPLVGDKIKFNGKSLNDLTSKGTGVDLNMKRNWEKIKSGAASAKNVSLSKMEGAAQRNFEMGGAVGGVTGISNPKWYQSYVNGKGLTMALRSLKPGKGFGRKKSAMGAADAQVNNLEGEQMMLDQAHNVLSHAKNKEIVENYEGSNQGVLDLAIQDQEMRDQKYHFRNNMSQVFGAMNLDPIADAMAIEFYNGLNTKFSDFDQAQTIQDARATANPTTMADEVQRYVDEAKARQKADPSLALDPMIANLEASIAHLKETFEKGGKMIVDRDAAVSEVDDIEKSRPVFQKTLRDLGVNYELPLGGPKEFQQEVTSQGFKDSLTQAINVLQTKIENGKSENIIEDTAKVQKLEGLLAGTSRIETRANVSTSPLEKASELVEEERNDIRKKMFSASERREYHDVKSSAGDDALRQQAKEKEKEATSTNEDELVRQFSAAMANRDTALAIAIAKQTVKSGGMNTLLNKYGYNAADGLTLKELRKIEKDLKDNGKSDAEIAAEVKKKSGFHDFMREQFGEKLGLSNSAMLSTQSDLASIGEGGSHSYLTKSVGVNSRSGELEQVDHKTRMKVNLGEIIKGESEGTVRKMNRFYYGDEDVNNKFRINEQGMGLFVKNLALIAKEIRQNRFNINAATKIAGASNLNVLKETLIQAANEKKINIDDAEFTTSVGLTINSTVEERIDKLITKLQAYGGANLDETMNIVESKFR